MNIFVNGKQIVINDNFTLKKLSDYLNLDLSKTVVELNGKIIEKNNSENTLLKENDKIEFIQFVGGG
jgi:sulfur carrier protein